MATKSILKTIEIRDSKSAKKLIDILEKAKDKKYKLVANSKKHNYLTKDDMLKMFGREE